MKNRVKRGVNIYSRTGEYRYLDSARLAIKYVYELGCIHQINYIYMDEKNGGVFIILNPGNNPDILKKMIDTEYSDCYFCDQILAFEDGFSHIEEPGITAIFVETKKERNKFLPMSITPKIRVEIISRDKGRCIICGQENHLEVHHIVPISIIKRLGLSEFLNVDKYNLTTLCRSCNIGIGDRLNKELIDLYIEKFKEKSHPNNGICETLNKIREIQS